MTSEEKELVSTLKISLIRGITFANEKNILELVKKCMPEPKTVRCKNCKYFEYDSVAEVDGIPLIVAHEICNKWADGCKTKENGFCFLFERKMESEGRFEDNR